MTQSSWNLVYRFEYFPEQLAGGANAPHYVRLRRVENGEILMVSQRYTRRWSAKRAATRMSRAFRVPVVAVDA